jgi:hypothetical protein
MDQWNLKASIRCAGEEAIAAALKRLALMLKRLAKKC